MGEPVVSSWQAFENEIRQWQKAGEVPSLWWRDDDANQDHPALQRLLSIAKIHRLPLSLAVIPHQAGKDLVHCFRNAPVTVLQHGYQHTNHAPPGKKKQELGLHRPLSIIVEELQQGKNHLQALFSAQFVPCLVPPWNRITDILLPHLFSLGFTGISTYGSLFFRMPRSGLRQVNTHIDILDFKAGRCFRGREYCLDLMVRHLKARREGEVDRLQCTGLLTHHLAHDDGCWSFCEELFERLAFRDRVQWRSVVDLLPEKQVVD